MIWAVSCGHTRLHACAYTYTKWSRYCERERVRGQRSRPVHAHVHVACSGSCTGGCQSTCMYSAGSDPLSTAAKMHQNVCTNTMHIDIVVFFFWVFITHELLTAGPHCRPGALSVSSCQLQLVQLPWPPLRCMVCPALPQLQSKHYALCGQPVSINATPS